MSKKSVKLFKSLKECSHHPKLKKGSAHNSNKLIETTGSEATIIMDLVHQEMIPMMTKRERRRRLVPREQLKAIVNKALKVQKEQDMKYHQPQASRVAHKIMTMERRKQKLPSNRRNPKIE